MLILTLLYIDMFYI